MWIGQSTRHTSKVLFTSKFQAALFDANKVMLITNLVIYYIQHVVYLYSLLAYLFIIMYVYYFIFSALLALVSVTVYNCLWFRLWTIPVTFKVYGSHASRLYSFNLKHKKGGYSVYLAVEITIQSSEFRFFIIRHLF